MRPNWPMAITLPFVPITCCPTGCDRTDHGHRPGHRAAARSSAFQPGNVNWVCFRDAPTKSVKTTVLPRPIALPISADGLSRKTWQITLSEFSIAICRTRPRMTMRLTRSTDWRTVGPMHTWTVRLRQVHSSQHHFRALVPSGGTSCSMIGRHRTPAETQHCPSSSR